MTPDELENANPKTLIGAKKPSITAIPASAILHCAVAMMNGVQKYGKYNWREKDVPLCTYVDAAMRHLLEFADNTDTAADSGIHHIAHAMACCAIILDALEGEHAIDDRGNPGCASELIERMTQQMPELFERWEQARKAK